jgi:hypothetical protein
MNVCIHGNLVGEKVSNGNAYEVRCGNCIAERINKNGMWRFDKEGNLKYVPTEMVSLESKVSGLEHKVADLDSAVEKLDGFVQMMALRASR